MDLELIYSNEGIGTVSEIFDGDPPYRPRGCIAQAWSVAEVLRAYRKTGEPHRPIVSDDPDRKAPANHAERTRRPGSTVSEKPGIMRQGIRGWKG